MVMIRGILEILKAANEDGPKTFNDFTKISVRNKRLSSATVSKRLDELSKISAIEEVIIRSKAGRRTIGYKTTEKGKRIFKIATELEALFQKSK